MVFNSFAFLLFFSVVVVGVMRLPAGVLRKVGLLAASYWFYALWDWRYAGLLALTCVVHWAAARINQRWSMWCAVVGSVLILAAFKYLGLWIDSIIMPVGISFYTFQAISYTVDCYNGKIDNKRSLLDVALYVSFFPQLLSGPIVRAADFFPQLDFRALNYKIKASNLAPAFALFTFGLFKKVFVADRMSVYVGRVFENCNLFDGWTLWLAAIAYTIQIYCDFSGYSDMAIGIARGIGFDYKKNFDHPYLSTSVTEFWRRWHISLSTWLRDYIYIPLGGNRKGSARQYLNQMLTMLIGGAWHGADMSFIAWGGLHGFALCVHKWWTRTAIGAHVPRLCFWKPVAWLLAMMIVVLGWVLFRAANFEQGWMFIAGMFSPSRFFSESILRLRLLSWIHTHVLVAMAMLVVGNICIKGKFVSDNCDMRKTFGLFLVMTLFLLSVVYPFEGVSPFIYFKF